MRKLIILALLCVPIWAQDGTVRVQRRAAAGGSAPTYIRNGTCSSGTTDCAITMANTAGSTLVLGMSSPNPPSTFSCTDGVNTYATGQANTAGPYHVGQIIMATSIAANASNTITCTRSATGGTWHVHAVEASSSALDKSAGTNFNNTATINSGNTATTTAADELLVAYVIAYAESNTFTATGWTSRTSQTTNNSTAILTKAVSSTGAYSFAATIPAADYGVSMLVTLK